MIGPKKREASASWLSRPVSKRLAAGRKAPLKPPPSSPVTGSSRMRFAQSEIGSLCPSPPERTGKTHPGVSDRGRQRKPETPRSLSSSSRFLSALIQSLAFASSENGIGRFCLSAGGTLGSRALSLLSERPSIRAAGTRCGHGENRNVEDDLQRPVARQRSDLGEFEVRGDPVSKNVPAREGEDEGVEAEPG